MLDGWGAIAEVLTTAAGVEVSMDQARRYEAHGLPIKRKGPGKRKRVTANRSELVEWCIKAFG